MTGAIFNVGVPATIIKSDWRGLGRNTPAPKRSMSKRDAPVAIISMAQQASPNVIGHSADLRAQLNTKSTVDVMIPLDDSITSSLWSAINTLSILD
jgi:transketolase